jgi:nucleotide-binding universal stress UspA family protein
VAQNTSGSKIVVGVDGSDGSSSAMRWTAELALRGDAEVIAVHAFPYEAMLGEDTNIELLERATAALEGPWTQSLRDLGVPYSTVIAAGDARTFLISVAVERNAKQIVVGSHGYSTLSDLLLGSVAMYLTHHSPVPVTVVRPDGKVAAAL